MCCFVLFAAEPGCQALTDDSKDDNSSYQYGADSFLAGHLFQHWLSPLGNQALVCGKEELPKPPHLSTRVHRPRPGTAKANSLGSRSAPSLRAMLQRSRQTTSSDLSLAKAQVDSTGMQTGQSSSHEGLPSAVTRRASILDTLLHNLKVRATENGEGCEENAVHSGEKTQGSAELESTGSTSQLNEEMGRVPHRLSSLESSSRQHVAVEEERPHQATGKTPIPHHQPQAESLSSGNVSAADSHFRQESAPSSKGEATRSAETTSRAEFREGSNARDNEEETNKGRNNVVVRPGLGEERPLLRNEEERTVGENEQIRASFLGTSQNQAAGSQHRVTEESAPDKLTSHEQEPYSLDQRKMVPVVPSNSDPPNPNTIREEVSTNTGRDSASAPAPAAVANLERTRPETRHNQYRTHMAHVTRNTRRPNLHVDSMVINSVVWEPSYQEVPQQVTRHFEQACQQAIESHPSDQPQNAVSSEKRLIVTVLV